MIPGVYFGLLILLIELGVKGFTYNRHTELSFWTNDRNVYKFLFISIPSNLSLFKKTHIQIYEIG